MVDMPEASNAAGSFNMDSISEVLGRQVTDGLHIDETLMGLREKNPDAFDSKLMQMRKDYQEFYNASGEIELEKLKDRLSWQERMALLVSHYLGENVLSMFFSGGNSEKAKTMPFRDALNYFAQHADKGATVRDGHLLWLGTTNPIAQLMVLFNFADMFKSKTAKDEEPFPLSPKSRIVISASKPSDGPKMTPTRFSILKAICKSKGLNLDLVNVGEVGTKGNDVPENPGEDTIQVIFVPPGGLPLSADGKTIDAGKLAWFKEIYEDEVPAQWVLTSDLLAAIDVLRGKSIEDSLKGAGIVNPTQAQKDLLGTIQT